ncbi:polyphosphate kinase 2 [Neorhizobium galegae]|uniref:polyphosphate kinase 2 n=1 Tax=Neorhizobium galegae TaxID=399 RepID=UPI0006225B9F|nr:polyphosphate kinase 2 [Neorhizobium galegae]KAB1127111.1 polyphosphate kinase 2 [Neorhizobium galegae]MCQ1808812.1 polyphosphate kinase 2 [Neorhizobium galegae]CDZ62300.1 Polyphosphate kinase 2 [Neorhizobium galegae bv. orientalis]
MADKTESRAVSIDINGKLKQFDIDDPVLPAWIEEHALGSGGYPHDDKLDKDKYAKQLEKLQVELVKVQFWLKATGKRMMALFEGRDAAGKGGTIFSINAYLNPRSARVVALNKPTETEAGQWYFQRYISHFPTSGEIVLFDRSWYNRAGVEPVMGFCTPEQYKDFMKAVPRFEDTISDEGIIFFKFWLDIGREMQLKRFHDRRHDPLKIWKLSPMDIAAFNKWDDYTEKRDAMLEKTHNKETPWAVIRANDKRRARLNVIRHILLSLDYEGKDKDAVGEIDDKIFGFGPKFLR